MRGLLKELYKATESQFTHHTKAIHASDGREMTDASTDRAYCEIVRLKHVTQSPA